MVSVVRLIADSVGSTVARFQTLNTDAETFNLCGQAVAIRHTLAKAESLTRKGSIPN